VRFARSSNFVIAGQGPDNNRQLFFAHMPTSAAEEDIHRLFSQFGAVESVDLFHDRRTRVSKGCGFVAMASREAAAAAMEALDDKLALEGATAPLAVKWVDPDLQYKKRKATASGNAENRMVRGGVVRLEGGGGGCTCKCWWV
jgi:RNA recognition motif-containing protein